ncbi:mitochondrial sodium/calcium exchanger protein-like isoform X1 [Drosophila albomicans]|uniref:Mitochondrial sodium/calcium exchanger protein-like isoform X1 n=1 Tax=Drosophila albomicans TaxID=7291 RepID=A0A6P8YAG3_DROAB|nr:mitochondrial sodium/calcium exchanger protein-like isoform X1 [Drosophila albomicans]
MNETISLKESYKSMNCFSVMEVDFQHRCDLSMAVRNCKYIMNFFNYFEILYCNFDIRSIVKERLMMGFFIIIMILLMIMIVHLVDKYISPVLKILSIKLHLSEYLAGVTLLSLGNSLSDLIVNLMPIRGHAPIFTITISNALAVILLSGGMICFLRPFHINGYCAIRDLLFLLLGAEMLIYIVFSETVTTKSESIILSLLYVIFVLVMFLDHKLLQRTIQGLYKQVEKLEQLPYAPHTEEAIRRKLIKLRKLEEECKLVEDNYRSTEWTWRRSGQVALNRKFLAKISDEEQFNEKISRNALYNPENPKNMFLIEEFLRELIPIPLEWKFSGWCRRIYLIILAPMALFCAIFIPCLDYRQVKHGWSKLLNCTQIITNPVLCVALIETMIENEYTKRVPTIPFTYAKWTLCFTIPLAIAVFFMSRTDRPPPFHLMFIVLSLTASLLLLIICSTELEVLFCIIGLVFHRTEDFVAACIRSFAGAIGDVILNIDLAMEGYEKMAFAASLAAPLFSITMSMGVPCFFNVDAQEEYSHTWIYGEYGANAYVFFVLAIISTLWWTSILNFDARRSMGVYSFILFMLFFLYTTLAEWNLVHQLSGDPDFLPI